jgi:hypothetical protein
MTAGGFTRHRPGDTQPTTCRRFGNVSSCSGPPRVTTTVPPTFTRHWPLQAFGSNANDIFSRNVRSLVAKSGIACRKFIRHAVKIEAHAADPAERRHTVER